jgi:outer membrane protein TolC
MAETAASSVAPARAITLPEALAYARAHQPQIRAALAEVAARRAEAGIPRAEWYPVLGATAQLFGMTANNTTATYVSPGRFMDVPRIGSTRVTDTGELRAYPSTFLGAGARQEVFDFGRIAAEAAAADAIVDVQRERARSEELEVAFNVQEAYFAVFAAKAIVDASDQAYQRSQTHRDLARAGVSSGLRPPIELTRAEADLAKFDIGRKKARGGLTVAQSVLAASVGVSDALLDVASAPPSPADMPGLAESIAQAEAHSPELREALQRLRAEEAASRAIGAQLRPDVWATGTLSARAGGAPPSSGNSARGDGWEPNVPNWDVGLVLSWPLFDGTVDAREQASRAREQVRAEEISVVRERQIAVIRTTYVSVEVARDALPALERAVQAARDNYTQADARFRAGLGTSVELADAEALRTDAEIQLALGQFDLARARAAFGRAIAEGP